MASLYPRSHSYVIWEIRMGKWWLRNRKSWSMPKDRLWRGLAAVIAGGLLSLLLTAQVNLSLQWVVRASPVIVLLIIIAFLFSVVGKKQSLDGPNPIQNNLGMGANFNTSIFPVDEDHESLGMVYTDISDSNQEAQSNEFWDAVEDFRRKQDQETET